MGFRRKARECAVQMLFQQEFTDDEVEVVTRRYFEHVSKVPAAARAHAERLFAGTIANREAIDSLIADKAENWRITRMARVDRNILRMAVYEFLHEQDTPARVIINEACDIAKKYGSDESVAFVNGILDAIMRNLERQERSA